MKALLRHVLDWATPVLEPVLWSLALRGDTRTAYLARLLLLRRNQQQLDRHGPASLAEFDRRVALLGPGDVCLDLGANLGIFTEKLAATGADVHAYEPDPHCFAQLQDRFAGRPNVHLHPKAVAATSGSFLLRRTRDFLDDPDLQSTSSSIAVAAPSIYDETNAVMVETVAFHDVVRGLGKPVALVKMDIEGAEFGILDLLQQDREMGKNLPIGALFVETHERQFPRQVPDGTRFAPGCTGGRTAFLDRYLLAVRKTA